VLTQPQADPRVIRPADRSTLRVRTLQQGQPVAGVVVWFDIDPDSSGSGAFGGAASAQATTDADGVASVQITGVATGLVHVQVTSASALNGDHAGGRPLTVGTPTSSDAGATPAAGRGRRPAPP
jgi:hypothetical protein